MRTRLLTKLRREAREHFQFKITQNALGTWAFVDSKGKTIKSFLRGSFVVERAGKYCKEELRKYILDRVKQMKK